MSEVAKSNIFTNAVYAFGFSYNVFIHVLVLLTTTIYVKKLELFCLVLTVNEAFMLHMIIRLLVSFKLSLSLKE